MRMRYADGLRKLIPLPLVAIAGFSIGLLYTSISSPNGLPAKVGAYEIKYNRLPEETKIFRRGKDFIIENDYIQFAYRSNPETCTVKRYPDLDRLHYSRGTDMGCDGNFQEFTTTLGLSISGESSFNAVEDIFLDLSANGIEIQR